MRHLLSRSSHARYIVVAILAFTVGSATIVEAAPGIPLFRLADATNDTQLASVDANGNLQVKVNNLAATQNVSGTVNVGNLPTTQQVAFASAQPVTVGNFPSTQPVSGSVSVSNLPATQPVSGTVNVGNLPTTQQVSGTVAVSNFPAQQQLVATHGTYIYATAQPGKNGSYAFAQPVNASYFSIWMLSGGCSVTLNLSGGGAIEFDPRGADLNVPFPVRLSVSSVTWYNFNVIGDCGMNMFVVSD